MTALNMDPTKIIFSQEKYFSEKDRELQIKASSPFLSKNGTFNNDTCSKEKKCENEVRLFSKLDFNNGLSGIWESVSRVPFWLDNTLDF